MLRLIAICIMGICMLSGCRPTPWMTQSSPAREEVVILLHGLARSDGSMKKMQQALAENGYGTCNIDYPSTDHTIDALTDDFIAPKIAECTGDQDVSLSFVTHSMGGIIVRNLMKKKPFGNLNAVVMLSPPNQGSEVVDKLGGNWLFKRINGPAGRQLGTAPTSFPNQLGPATFKVGIITGDATINVILSMLIPGDDDGKVSIQRAKLSGMADFMVVNASHPFIMKKREVIEQTLFFLENHRFRHDGNG